MTPTHGCAPCGTFRAPAPFSDVLLLDDLVRLEEERRGHGQTERLRRLEVDVQLELRRLLHRQVGRLSVGGSPERKPSRQTFAGGCASTASGTTKMLRARASIMTSPTVLSRTVISFFRA